MASAEQKTVIEILAAGTNFKLNETRPLEEEFDRLCVKKGWGDKSKRKNWRKLFGTEYRGRLA